MEEIKGTLITVETLKSDFEALGVQEGMTILVHSSFKSLGQWVLGGPATVVLGLEEIVSKRGTVVMPTHSGDLSDPSGWENPPAPKDWWDTIREQMPVYRPDLTALWKMGIISETFRKQQGVERSGHPQLSFAAWGEQAKKIIMNHSLDDGLGENSPLARIYDINGMVLLLGVGHYNNTSLHLAEYRAEYSAKKEIISRAPMNVNGIKQWVPFREIELDSSDFERIGRDFEQETGKVKRGKVAGADAMLIPQRELVDYAVQWMQLHRG